MTTPMTHTSDAERQVASIAHEREQRAAHPVAVQEKNKRLTVRESKERVIANYNQQIDTIVSHQRATLAASLVANGSVHYTQQSAGTYAPDGTYRLEDTYERVEPRFEPLNGSLSLQDLIVWVPELIKARIAELVRGHDDYEQGATADQMLAEILAADARIRAIEDAHAALVDGATPPIVFEHLPEVTARRKREKRHAEDLERLADRQRQLETQRGPEWPAKQFPSVERIARYK